MFDGCLLDFFPEGSWENHWEFDAGTLSRVEESKGLQVVLTCVHNVTAPLSMLFCMIMETVQLGYGETLGAGACVVSLHFASGYQFQDV